MDSTNVSDKCVVKIIRSNAQVDEKVIEDKEQSVREYLEFFLQKLILLNKGEKK